MNAGQQPGVPFQIGTTTAQRAVGEKRQAVTTELAASIRKGSIYFERVMESKLTIGFSYDAKLPIKLNIYISAKDRSDTNKLKYDMPIFYLCLVMPY